MREDRSATAEHPNVGRVVAPDGVALSYADHGGPDGAPVLILVHGYPDDRHVWDLVVPDLVVDHRVVTPDVRGAGHSAAPVDRRGYRTDRLVADLLTVADAVAPDEPIHLVGHDWGSIGSWAAVLDPVVARRIASYSSLSGPPLDHIAGWLDRHRRPGDGRWRALLTQAASSWYVYLFHTPLAPLAWRCGLARRWPRLLRRAERVQVDDRWPGPNLLRDAVDGIQLYRANMFHQLRRHRGLTTDVPVQLIVARRDPFVTERLLDGLESTAADLVRVSIDSGHWAPRSRPTEIADLIREHVARNLDVRFQPAGRG